MAYNSAYTGSQIDAAVGAVRQKETIWDGKQDELTGTEDQLVGFNSAGEAVAVAKPDPLPAGGETGQVLTKTAEGTAWDDVPSDLPAGGTDGQILTKTADGVAWEDAPEAGVASFKGRTGAVTPQEGDYTANMVGARPDTWTPSAEDVGAVPTSRTVNGQELSQDINLTADNVGARPSTWTPTASDVGAIPNPSGGTTGQILEKTATGTQWADKPASGIPIVTTGGTGSAYTASVPEINELKYGIMLIIIPHVNSNADATLNVNGFGAIDLQLTSWNETVGGFWGVKSGTLHAGAPYLLFLSYRAGPASNRYWQILSQPVMDIERIIVIPSNYTGSQVRGIALQTSTPSSIPAGSIVGVYST